MLHKLAGGEHLSINLQKRSVSLLHVDFAKWRNCLVLFGCLNTEVLYINKIKTLMLTLSVFVLCNLLYRFH